MSQLDEIARRHGTDKSYKHNYCHIYEQAFSKFTAPRLLEIGVLHGASVRMWCEYFPKGQIVAIDRCPERTQGVWPTNAMVMVGNQADVEFLEWLGGQWGMFDIVVDDGSHRWDHQQISLQHLWTYVAPGGVYAIEDLHTSKQTKYQGQAKESTLTILQQMQAGQPGMALEDLTAIEIYDDKLALLHKSDWPLDDPCLAEPNAALRKAAEWYKQRRA